MASQVYVESPTPRPLPFGLLSVADERPGGNGHWQQGIQYANDNCVQTLATTSGYCVVPAGTSEVQTVTITGTPTGGTFILTAFGQSTTPLAHNASGATVQAALNALAAFDPGDVTVTGNAPAYTLTFGGQYASRDVGQVGAAHTFTGGTTPGVTVATTTAGVRTPKTLTDSAADIEGSPFTVYAIRQCGTVGDYADAANRAMKMFNASEGIAVEKGFWAYLTANATTVTDITGGTAADTLAEGLAALEQYAGETYGGSPTIHVDRAIGSLLGSSRSIERHGNRLETVQGALVASGGGYDSTTGPDGTAAGAGEAWLFVSGVVSLWRGVAHAHGPFLQTDASRAYLNQSVVLVERTYLASPDCLLGAIRAKVV